MDIFFVRHGKTDANVRGLFAGGGLDVPVSAQGLVEAKLIARSERFIRPFRNAFSAAGVMRNLSDSNFLPALVYTSPMTRAKQTASIFFPNARQEEIEDFREFKFGAFEGKAFRELQDDPDYITWKSGNNDSRCPPDGDSVNSCTQRVTRAFTDVVLKQKNDAPIVIVAHGGVAMAFLHAYIDGAKPFFSWDTPNCGVWHFDCALVGGKPALTVIEEPAFDAENSLLRYGIENT